MSYGVYDMTEGLLGDDLTLYGAIQYAQAVTADPSRSAAVKVTSYSQDEPSTICVVVKGVVYYTEQTRSYVKAAHDDRIYVEGILPANAHRFLSDAPDKAETFGAGHKPTYKGLNNALKKMNALGAEYKRTHGDAAAYSLWLVYRGEKIRGGMLAALKQVGEFGAFDQALDQAERMYTRVCEYEVEQRAQERNEASLLGTDDY